jgi:hypothetical protein
VTWDNTAYVSPNILYVPSGGAGGGGGIRSPSAYTPSGLKLAYIGSVTALVIAVHYSDKEK